MLHSPTGTHQKSRLEEFTELLKDDHRVKVAGIDLDGILRGKVMVKSKFLSILESGFGFCSVIFGWDMHDKTYPEELSVSNAANGNSFASLCVYCINMGITSTSSLPLRPCHLSYLFILLFTLIVILHHRLQGHHRDSRLDDVQKDPMGGQHSILFVIVLRTPHEGTLGGLS